MEIFNITLLSLEGILKRVSFKDTVLFKDHNSDYKFDSNLFTASISFNLFSEYGIGNKLEPLLEDLFRNGKLEYDLDNIFIREVFDLVPIICPIIRNKDNYEENVWACQYSINNLNKVDKISGNRLERLYPLFENNPDNEENECMCGFCQEFRKYYTEDPPKNIILKVLEEINRKVNDI